MGVGALVGRHLGTWGWRSGLAASAALAALSLAHAGAALEPFCPGEAKADPAVLFCDDFDDGRPLAEKYFEYDDSDGSFVLAAGQGRGGSRAMRARWRAGQVGAGSLKFGFGRNPVRSQTASDRDFRELFWRIYVRTQPGWTGSPEKLSRATSLVSTKWAQSMIAHVWSGDRTVLTIDPASGTDDRGRLRAAVYNDFANLRWLGSRDGRTGIYDTENADRWFCIEARVKLNTPGRDDGVFSMWIDGELEAERADLNWLGSYADYGINAVFIENYWNVGAPATRERYLDNFVVSTGFIGCGGPAAAGTTLGMPPQPTLVDG